MAVDVLIEVKKAGIWYPQVQGGTLKERFINLRGFTRKKWVLRDVSLSVRRKERIVIIGRNGSGKTTLLRLMGGILAPDEGEVKIRGRVTSVIELGLGFHPYLTGRENIFLYGAILGFTKKEIENVYDEIVDFSELHDYINAPLYTYSSGMKLRLAFSIAFSLTPDVFLRDEIYAVADLPFQEKSRKKLLELHERGTAYVGVTHEIHLLFKEGWDRAIWIDDGRIRMEGPAPEVAEAYTKEVLR